MQQRPDHFMSPGMLDSQFAALEEPISAFTVDVAQDVGFIVDEIAERIRSGTRASGEVDRD